MQESKIFVFSTLWIILLLFYSGAGYIQSGHAQVSAAPQNVKIGSASLTAAQRYSAAMQIVAAKCTSCHRIGGSATDFTRFLMSQSAWVDANYVVPGNAQSSLLFKYLQGSGFTSGQFGLMPIGGVLTSTELEIFRSWINQFENLDVSPIATPTPNSGTSSGQPFLASQDYPRLGDRLFIHSVLNDVFGPSAQTVTDSLVFPRASIFGGSCDSMKQPPAHTQLGLDTCDDLDISSYSGPFVPISSAPRAGLTMKVCNKLVFQDLSIQYAIQAATQKTDLSYLSSNSIPTNAEIIAAYSLFYPGKSAPPLTVVNTLLAVAQAVQSPNFPSCPDDHSNCRLDPWRYVLLTLCYQPDWQVI